MQAVSGNSCLYCLFRMGTLCCLVVGLGNLGAGLIVYVKTEALDWYTAGYMGLGLELVVAGVIGDKTRRSRAGSFCYLFALLLTLAAELGFTLWIVFYSDYENLMGTEYSDIARYSLFAGCGIILYSLVVGCVYRSSLNRAHFERRHQHLLETRLTEISAPKTQAKREELEKKYPELRKTLN